MRLRASRSFFWRTYSVGSNLCMEGGGADGMQYLSCQAPRNIAVAHFCLNTYTAGQPTAVAARVHGRLMRYMLRTEG